MPDSSHNNTRIAKNALMLYFRMFLIMIVSLFTSRVILDSLGVEDYGIYNVVGGVVAMFSVLSGALTSAISRFITYELGKGNIKKLRVIFSSSVLVQIVISILIVVIAEIVGIWFINNKMDIPDSRLVAANWVFHFSLVAFVINLISIPYNACIIAHEHMSTYAYVSIVEVVGKLGIAYLIYITPFDRLISYSILTCLIALVIRLIYGFYCKKHFEECEFRFVWDKSVMKEIFSFAGWNFIGSSSAILRDQGGNIIINLFYGPLVNAAYGIAYQVKNAVQSFSNNFMTALNPQIIKSYAANDLQYMESLLFQGARFSFYILLFIALPILVETQYILEIWLKIVPEHTVLLVRLSLVFILCEVISNPLVTAAQATGKIRNYQLVVGGLQCLNIPVSYLLLKFGAGVDAVLVTAIIISQCCLCARLVILKNLIGLKVILYLRKVWLNVIIVSLFSILIPVIANHFMMENLCGFICTVLVCFICTVLSALYIGCSTDERKVLFAKLSSYLKKINPKLR